MGVGKTKVAASLGAVVSLGTAVSPGGVDVEQAVNKTNSRKGREIFRFMEAAYPQRPFLLDERAVKNGRLPYKVVLRQTAVKIAAGGVAKAHPLIKLNGRVVGLPHPQMHLTAAVADEVR